MAYCYSGSKTKQSFPLSKSSTTNRSRDGTFQSFRAVRSRRARHLPRDLTARKLQRLVSREPCVARKCCKELICSIFNKEYDYASFFSNFQTACTLYPKNVLLKSNTTSQTTLSILSNVQMIQYPILCLSR